MSSNSPRSTSRTATTIPNSRRPRNSMAYSRRRAEDYVDLIDVAVVYEVATRTPLELAGNLSARLGNRILLKREDLQPVFSFKLRGAYNKIASLSQQRLALGSYAARPETTRRAWHSPHDGRARGR